jgi:hypothetical protein
VRHRNPTNERPQWMGLKVPTTYCLSSRARARRGANRQDGSAHASRWEWIRIIFLRFWYSLMRCEIALKTGFRHVSAHTRAISSSRSFAFSVRMAAPAAVLVMASGLIPWDMRVMPVRVSPCCLTYSETPVMSDTIVGGGSYRSAPASSSYIG